MVLCSHTPTRQAAPPLCSCPCMCRTGPDIKSARCFSEPACMGGCSPLTTMSPAQKRKKSIIRVRDDDGGAALHCIRSSSCHPSPGHRESIQHNCLRGTLPASNHHTRSRSRVHANKQTATDDGAHQGVVDTQTRRHGRPNRRGRPSSDCRSGSALRENQNVQKRLPTGLTQGPGFSLPAGQRRYPGHTLWQPTELALTYRRTDRQTARYLEKAPCDVSRLLAACPVVRKAATRADLTAKQIT